MADQKSSPSPATPAWRGPIKGQAGKRVSKRRRFFTVLTVMLALVGVIAAWLLLLHRPPQSFLLYMAITEYKDERIPVNAQAIQDREALLKGEYFAQQENAFPSQEQNLLLEKIAALKAKKEGPVVVYLSAYLVSNPRGELFILPGNGKIDQPGTWVRFRHILESFRDCPAPHKLLILDTMRPIADPSLGLLSNDIAQRVMDALSKVKDEKRLVLCACSPGQVSLSSAYLGQSAFGYYLDEGLRGWADGCIDGKANNRVTVEELYTFVRERVDHWALINRGVHQTPVLVGSGDFELAVVKEGEPKDQKNPEPPPSYPDWLTKAWEMQDQWAQDRVARSAPQLVRRLEATVLRAEQRWRGGAANVQSELEEELKRSQSRLLQVRKAVEKPRARSIALAGAWGQWHVDAAALEAVQASLKGLENLGPAKESSEQAKKIRQGLLAKFKDKPLDLAQAVFEAAADTPNPPPRTVQLLYGLLGEQQSQPQFVETLFLKRLADLARRPGIAQHWRNDTAGLALEAARQGEKAEACDPKCAGGWEPRAFPWVRDLLEQAAQKRHDAEVRLFNPGFASLDEANDLFKEAIQEFKLVQQYVAMLQVAYRTRDKAMARVPGLATYLMNKPEFDANAKENWNGTVQDLIALHGLLGFLPTETRPLLSARELRQKLDDIRQQTDSLRSHLNQLSRPFQVELENLKKQANRLDSGSQQYVEIEALLGTPCLHAKDRKELWALGQKLAKRLHEKARASEPPERRQLPRPEQISDLETKRAILSEHEHAARRAQISIDLLKVASFAGVEELQRALAPAWRDRSKPFNWPDFGQRLRQAWADKLGKQLQEEKDPVARDRLNRSLPSWHSPVGESDLASDASLELWTMSANAFRAWLADRSRYESLDLGSLAHNRDDFVPVFYDEAARDYGTGLPALPRSSACKMDDISPPPVFLKGGSRELTCVVRLELTPATVGNIVEKIRAITADQDWLRVTAPTTFNQGKGAGPFEIPLTIRLKAGAEDSATPRPNGFLIQANVNGRSFYCKVSLPTLPLPTSKQLQILVGNDRTPPVRSIHELALRPNTSQMAYVFVRNPTDKERTVIVQVKADGSGGELARSKPTLIRPDRDPTPVPFDGAAALAANKAMVELQGMLRFQLLDAANSTAPPLDEKTVRITPWSPSDYVQITNVQYQPKERKLLVEVAARETILGPPCRVQLVLSKDRIPGLIGTGERGNFADTLTQNRSKVLLTAEKIQFEDGRSVEDGDICLTVDGYERAFIFRVTFANRGTPTAGTPVFAPELRLQGPEAIPSGPSGKDYDGRLEVDNGPNGATLEVGLDPAGDGAHFQWLQRFKGARHQRLGFAGSGSNGALLFTTTVEDWPVKLDTRDIAGRRTIKARLLDRFGEVVREQQASVVFDKTGPENVTFLRVNSVQVLDPDKPLRVELKADDSLVVKAKGRDPESGISKVLFFFGQPVKGQPPATAKEGQPLDREKTQWSASLAPKAFGRMDLTVQFINGAGMARFASLAIELAEAKAVKPEFGKIVATVIDEAGRKQPNAAVTLKDNKGNKKESKTDGKGRFVFEDVAPGLCQITASKATSGEPAVGKGSVTAEAGKTKEITIKLIRK